ncbi:unnamed protein product, partial [Iphiclides podalirius]
MAVQLLTPGGCLASSKMNYCLAVTCLLALAATSKADGTLDGLIYAPGHSSPDYYAYPSYAFEYAVKDPNTGDNKAQWEKRDGDTVKGAYSLVEPDGSLRVVEYWADAKSGFNAVVKRVGPNLHPASAPEYKAPIRVLSKAVVAPISVGPVAKIDALSSAPVISGSLYGGAVSTAALYKAAPIVKSVAPIAPAYKAPFVQQIIAEPYPRAPIYTEPIYNPVPIKSQPVMDQSYLAQWPLLKDSLSLNSLASLGDGLLKDSLIDSGSGYDLGYGPLLSSWGSLGLGLKH